MRPVARVIARALVPAAVLAVVVLQVGLEPFLRGLRAVSPAAVLAALAITAATTLCSAWRWRLVAAALGDWIPLRRAVAWYYRSQLLNSVLPFGVAGDVHRGLAQGSLRGRRGQGGRRSRALREVAWERLAGQVVSIAAATLLVVLLGPPALRRVALLALAVVATGLVVAAILGLLAPHRIGRVLGADLRALATAGTGRIALASALATSGHVAVFVVAARAVRPQAPVGVLVPLALVVLLAASVPLNLAGWGPREGAAAWAFGVVGLGAATGVEVAATYGVLALAATLPGIGPLLAAARPARQRSPAPRRIGVLDG
jgi:glycosyltransferase 2 family protein